jgi:glutaredoxin
MRRVWLYTKEGCHLCERAKAILDRLAAEDGLEVLEVDITSDLALWQRYHEVIPVVRLDDGTEFVSKISEFRLRRALEGGAE